MIDTKNHKPRILAPAGGKASFLAALAAGADAIYCGLKSFSARMAAENFTPAELCALTELAHKKGVKVFVALNTLVRPGEIFQVRQMIHLLGREVGADALIVQDLSVVELAKQAGFKGELHLSTLGAVTFSKALGLISSALGVSRVVLPREFHIDEIKQMARACPPGMSLEVFVHGALCYGVSGRCYWSSYMGGKSGLRGRCVQPCRRTYTQARSEGRWFSCLDFSVDVLTKTLLPLPQITAWKIEGRKKGPHYVYYTTTAYKLLRDHGNDPKMKKDAMGYLEQALGRKTTHYNFLPQRPYPPSGQEEQTGSGLLAGRVKSDGSRPALSPRMGLIKGDLLRIGYEDKPGHSLLRVPAAVPARGRLVLKVRGGVPAAGTPVFLIDRMEDALETMIRDLGAELTDAPCRETASAAPDRAARQRRPAPGSPEEMTVYRSLPRGRQAHGVGLWLSLEERAGGAARLNAQQWLWLPPVVWQEDADRWQALVSRMVKQGARRFVLNAPWQISLFERTGNLDLWAGPFCNQANGVSIQVLAGMGFSGVIVSPELGKEDYAVLPGQSPVLLGVVVSGSLPLCVARTLPGPVREKTLFSSPGKENAWAEKHSGLVWLYPDWMVDLRPRQKMLEQWGYRLFVHLHHSPPQGVKIRQRPGMWNWDVGLP
ncbi:MAG: U32 family peptidase [Thermodesulfobacteriota bacterium]|nr:U32 family peptidase [Thermodesulfobacteriota bacterium]